MRLAGKKALVTGGAGAIGTGISRGLAREGADVAIAYHNSAEKAAAVAEDIKAMGRNAVTLYGDQTQSGDIQQLISGAVEAFGRLDIVINNAATGPQIPLLDLTEADVDSLLQTNLRGYFLTSLYGARQMVAQGGGGCIVNISSISSRAVTSSYVHYAATKGGIEATTRGFASALGRHGIRVNCVAPGCVMTPTVRNMFEDPTNADPVNGRTPLGRIVTIEECVGPVIFFCSDDSSGITGQVLDVDGGYCIQGMEWQMSQDMVKFRLELEKAGY